MEFASLPMIGLILFLVLVVIPFIATRFLRDVPSGNIRMVSWLQGSTVIYRGPGKSKEIPILTTGTTVPSEAINVDLDIMDQTADRDEQGVRRPIGVHVKASAIVAIGDSDEMIRTAANLFFSKTPDERKQILEDLLSSSARRAINLLTHDQLFSAASSAEAAAVTGAGGDADDNSLSVIIRRACSVELHDLGLAFKSLNLKVVDSEVAKARRQQAEEEARANAAIAAATQRRRAREAELQAEKEISDKERDLAKAQAENAAEIAEAEALRQTAVARQRAAELSATQTAQATADAERVKIEALAAAEAEAARIRTIAEAQAESISRVNAAIREGGAAYLQYRQVEMLPELVPQIAAALATAKMVTISGDGESASAGTASQIQGVIQAVLATQVVQESGLLAPPPPAAPAVVEIAAESRL